MENLLNGLVLGVHLVSAHFPAGDGLNNVNPGVYVRAESGLTVGVYRNTLRRTSAYAGWTFTTDVIPEAPISLTVGAVSGYRFERKEVACKNEAWSTRCFDWEGYSSQSVVPMVAPSIALPLSWATPRLTVIPGIGKGSSAVHLSVEWCL